MKVEKKPEPVKQKTSADETQLKSLARDLRKIEERIEMLQTEKSKLEVELARPEVYSDFGRLNAVQEKFNQVNKNLIDANAEWEKLAIAIDEINNAR